MWRCEACESTFAEHYDSCPDCGAEPTVFRCRRCGENFAEGDSCPACGQARTAFACDRHPDRTADGRCVVCGTALCPTCRHGDRALLCGEHRAVPIIQGWAQVYSTASEFEAQLLRENLAADGIEARIFSQRDKMLSVELGELSIVRLLVPAYDYLRALGFISSHMDRDGEVSFACPACGEAFEGGDSSCTACGNPLLSSSG